MTLFVYGTLADPGVLQRVAGQSFVAEAAVLDGYRRVEIAGCYPFIEPHAGAQVAGVVLTDVDQETLGRLDDYEDEGVLYHRRPVTVRVGDASRACEAYIGDRVQVLAVERD